MNQGKTVSALAGGVILAAAILSVLIVAACLVFILFRRYRLKKGDLVRVHETGMSAVLGLALWFEVLVILYAAMTMPERLLVDTNSQINTAIFMLAGAVAGSLAMLNYFVKCTVVRENELIIISMFGQHASLEWRLIKSISGASGKRATLVNSQDKTIKISGEPKSFQKFLALAKEKLPETH